jgi:hypothetical protein
MANYNFPATSRYYETPVKKLVTADGEELVHLARRLCPAASSFALLRMHTVAAGERLDLIAGAELGDPQAFWRIADANDAMAPAALTAEVGRRLRIGLPAGIPATPLT